MSEFDEEAEREKLREQLEKEERDRQASQRMSELLLGGATMTGRHCGECASPIFRQNGREFCPTCNQVVGESGDGSAQAGTDQRPAGQQATDHREGPEQGDGDLTVEPAGRSAPEPQTADRTPVDRQPDATAGSVPSSGTGEVAAPESGAGDLAAARDALARKLTRLAAQAEATDDVGRARELLAAIREAAEALAALERVGEGR